MIFHILMNQVTTLFLSLNFLTTLSFESEIVSFMYGGSKESVFFKVTNNNKTLALKPIEKGGYSNLLVVTKQRKFYFDLKGGSSIPHQFIEIKHGVINHMMKKVHSTPKYEVLEGDSSVLFINKGQDTVVNGTRVKTKEYFSKGVPLIINGNRVIN